MSTLSMITTKMLGDAGEYFALSQFIFAGKPAAKMPDFWVGYDLSVETGQALVRVSVKTRSESDGWKTSKWFIFDERKECDWLVFLFQPISGPIRSWVLPFAQAKFYGNKPTSARKDPHNRDVSWAKLTKPPLDCYENNWALNP
jgi:hypothetical protein